MQENFHIEFQKALIQRHVLYRLILLKRLNYIKELDTDIIRSGSLGSNQIQRHLHFEQGYI